MRDKRWSSLFVGIVVVAVAIGFALAMRPAATPEPSTEAGAGSAAAAGASATPDVPASPGVTTDRRFCAEFRSLAEAQAEYVGAGEQDADALQAVIDAMVRLGVPASMSLPARSGYYAQLNGIYSELSMVLDPASVGAPAEPAPDGGEAFSAYLQQACPA